MRKFLFPFLLLVISGVVLVITNPDSPQEEPQIQIKPIDVLFSPDGGIQRRIMKEMDETKSSIDIVMYSFTQRYVARVLQRAKKRGVTIRLIMDSENIKENNSQWSYFDKNGFEIKLLSGKKIPQKDEGTKDKYGVMHHKFFIFDGKLLMTGSYNMSESAEKYNHENVLFIADKDIITKYQERFEKLWIAEPK